MDIDENKIKSFCDDFYSIETEIKKSIVGQKDIINNVLTAVICGGNVLLEGLPGLGKTQLVKTIGNVFKLTFSRIQFTPDLMPSDVTGTDIMMKNLDGSREFKFQQGPIFSNIILADEINRATPKTQSALLEAMQEKTVTVGSTTYKLPDPFFVLATQNPIELEGTYPLPEAQMDRFLFKLNVKFPAKSELLKIVDITTGNNDYVINEIFDKDKIKEMGLVASNVPISEAVADYAMNIILSLHPESDAPSELAQKYIRYGPSPRGAQSLISSAKVFALIDGRFNVSYDDINKAALPSLRHRIFLNFEAAADSIDSDYIIKSILKE